MLCTGVDVLGLSYISSVRGSYRKLSTGWLNRTPDGVNRTGYTPELGYTFFYRVRVNEAWVFGVGVYYWF
jgi:hypothetical protein